MKLTLSVSGGFTGITKQKSISLDSLNEKTRTSVVKFFEEYKTDSSNTNLMEAWTLDDKLEVPVQRQLLPAELKTLYDQMKKKLAYVKK